MESVELIEIVESSEMRVKPRIMILSTNSDEAGAPLHVEMLVQALAHDVDFTILFGKDGPVLRRLKDAGFDARLLSGMRSAISPLADLKLLRRIDFLIAEIKPDLIHCHSSKAGLLGRLAGRRRRVPVLFSIHGWSWSSVSGPKSQLALMIERMVATLRGVHFLYVCEAVETTGYRMLGLRADQGTVICNGVQDLSYGSRPRNRTPHFIMPARVSYPKDHETLVRAFESLPEESRLVLCGTGTDSEEFSALVRQWAPMRHTAIDCLGPRSDIPDLLHQADVMVLSSASEAMPLSIIEAMSTGLPVIASDVGGIPELIAPEFNGYLVPAGDITSFALAMTKLIDPQRREDFGRQSRLRYETAFTVSIMAQQTLACYRRLIKIST
ncbi:glycosyltransferase [Pseudorhodobacter ferrugineus]|uniref:glycosyltransferase n=1 Tax=Pseudorhodobacter ferrugineus TaxID=77008 RepID=UPI000A950EDB|nr:glycosyltransferase [Pseudorhodobacter ferrugineus]